MLSLGIDTQDHDVDFVANLDKVAGVIHSFHPGHFADVNQAFDARFQFDERPVAHHVDDLTLDLRVDGVLLDHVVPGILFLLFEAKCDFFFFAIDIEDHDLDLLVDADHFRRVPDAFPAHVSNVEQTVDAAQVDEGTKFRDIFHHTTSNLLRLELREQFFPIAFSLLFDERSAANDDIAPCFVNLQYFALNRTIDVVADIARASNVDLTSGQEYIDADVDQQAAFDFSGNFAGDHLAFVQRRNHLFPLLDDLGALLTNLDATHFIFDVFDQHLHDVAGLRRIFFGVPFRKRNTAFTLKAHVNKHGIIVN